METIFNQDEYNLFKLLASLSQEGLRQSMILLLEKYYSKENIQATSHYIWAEGKIPICLVAHLDTIHKMPLKNLYFDKEKDVLWSPQGLGADDRAGVFAIVSILKDGHLPHIIFTTDEEKGGIGASCLSNSPNPFKDVRYFIEIDRQGSKDCVFYDCDNEKFRTYIEKFGFQTEWGTYTDICEFCPRWGIAGVNLSTGYYFEHSLAEILKTKELKATIKKIKRMLLAKNIPSFKHIPLVYGTNSYFLNFNWGHFNPATTKRICGKCQKVETIDMMLPVLQNDLSEKYYCGKCLQNVLWCSQCGEPFDNNTGICPKCQQKNIKE